MKTIFNAECNLTENLIQVALNMYISCLDMRILSLHIRMVIFLNLSQGEAPWQGDIIYQLKCLFIMKFCKLWGLENMYIINLESLYNIAPFMLFLIPTIILQIV